MVVYFEQNLCKLAKSFSSLREALKLWHKKCDKALVSNRYANKTKRMLASNFNLKNIRETNVILGIKVTKNSDNLMLS